MFPDFRTIVRLLHRSKIIPYRSDIIGYTLVAYFQSSIQLIVHRLNRAIGRRSHFSAEEQELQPALTRDRLDQLVKDCHLRTLPSEIAANYVGIRWSTSGANVKKLILLVDPKRMQEALGKYLKRAYLPADFESIKQSTPTPFASRDFTRLPLALNSIVFLLAKGS